MNSGQPSSQPSGQRSSTSRATAMPYANYQTEQERHPDILSSMFDTYGDTLTHSQGQLYMTDPFYSGQSWVPSERISVGPNPSCHPQLLHPHYSTNDAYGQTSDWAWNQPHCSQSFPGARTDSVVGSALLSPSGSSQYSYSESERATPSPMQLNEFSNVFESDFTRGVSAPHSLSLASSITRRRASYGGPTGSPYSRQSPDLRKSREPSPTLSDPDSKRRFPCLVDGCTRRFTSQYTLKVHMEAHKPKPRVAFPCTMGCSETFSRQHDRLRHEVAKHGKVCEFLCDDCGRFFSSSKTLGNHRCPVAQGGTRWVHI